MMGGSKKGRGKGELTKEDELTKVKYIHSRDTL
jgi:hypothetical protein